MARADFDTVGRRADGPIIEITFDDGDLGRFTVGAIDVPDGLTSLSLEGRWDRGYITIEAIHMTGNAITADQARIKLGSFTRQIAYRIKSDPDHADLRSEIYRLAEPTTAIEALGPSARRGMDAAHAAKEHLVGTGNAPRRGRPPLSPEFLAWLSERHLERYEFDPPRHVAELTKYLRSVASVEGEPLTQLIESDRRRITPNVRKETVKSWLNRARLEGWLTRPGQPGFRLIERRSKSPQGTN